jgi:hypothetical protein
LARNGGTVSDDTWAVGAQVLDTAFEHDARLEEIPKQHRTKDSGQSETNQQSPTGFPSRFANRQEQVRFAQPVPNQTNSQDSHERA